MNYNKEYYKTNRKKLLAYQIEYRKKNKQKINDYKLKWYHKNLKKIRKYRETFKLKNPGKAKKYRHQYYKKNKTQSRIQNYKNKFNISLNEYNRMFKKQKGLCVICRKKESVKGNTGRIRVLAVDHCHKTNKVRALLCTKCNIALGLFQDNLKVIKRAFHYLKSFN